MIEDQESTPLTAPNNPTSTLIPPNAYSPPKVDAPPKHSPTKTLAIIVVLTCITIALGAVAAYFFKPTDYYSCKSFPFSTAYKSIPPTCRSIFGQSFSTENITDPFQIPIESAELLAEKLSPTPQSPTTDLTPLPPIPAQIPWETESNYTYDQALIDSTNFNFYPLTGTLHTYTYDNSNTTVYQTILQSFLSQLESKGWQQRASFNQISYAPLQADGPTGGTDGRLTIDTQGNVRVILWSQYGTSCTNPGECASIELELFISETIPLITLPTD